jgi:hypothetical protein
MPVNWHDVFDNADKLVRIAATLLAGVWAYFKFIRGRIYRPRLEPSVSGQTFVRDEKHYLIIFARLKNVGAAKLSIDKETSGVRVFLCDSFTQTTPPDEPEWVRVATFGVFEQHGWIESSELIEDQLLVVLPPHQIAAKVELRIVARGINWYARTIVKIDAPIYPKEGRNRSEHQPGRL